MKKFMLKPCAIKNRRYHYMVSRWTLNINIVTVKALINFDCITYTNNFWYINSLNIIGNEVIIIEDLFEVTHMSDIEIEELQHRLKKLIKGIPS